MKALSTMSNAMLTPSNALAFRNFYASSDYKLMFVRLYKCLSFVFVAEKILWN